MKLRTVALTVGAALAAGVAALVAGERKLLKAIDSAPLLPNWVTPVFPDGFEIVVPTDDGAELLVGRAGPEDGPVVVLVHGLTSNHHDWGPVAQALVDDGFNVVGINQRGHGGSTVGSQGFGPARQGADVGQVLTALNLNDVTLAGHSMGGVAALGLMTLRPETGADRVAKLVLVATLADAVGPDRRNALKMGNSERYRNIADNDTHAAAGARFVFGTTMPSRAMVNDALASYRRCPFETRIGAAVGMIGYDVRHLLPKISVPTTVLCGTKDRLTKHSENRAIAEAIPGAVMVSVVDAGHLVIWEQVALVASTIAEAARVDKDAIA